MVIICQTICESLLGRETEEQIRSIFDDNGKKMFFSIKTYVVGAQQGDSNDHPQLATHNIGFMEK